MKQQLLKRLLFVLAVLGITNVYAQSYDFTTTDEGWFATSQMILAFDNDDATNGWGAADGGIICTRSGSNATIKPPMLIDGTQSNRLKLVVQNKSDASTLRFLVTEETGSSWLTFSISSNDTEFQTYIFDIDQEGSNWTLSGNNTPVNPSYWGEADENVSVLFRGAVGAIEGDVFIDEISFINIVSTFNAFIQNPGFEDAAPLDALGPWAPAPARAFAEVALSDVDPFAGTSSMKITYTAAATNNILIDNSYSQTGLNFGDDVILKASMWVKVKTADDGDKPVDIQAQFRINQGGSTYQRVNKKTTSAPNGTWERLEFQVGMATGQSIDDIRLRWNVQNTIQLVMGDEIFFDNINGCVDCPTLSTEYNEITNFGIYPNPANDYIELKTLLQDVKIDLFSIIGKLVKSEKAISDEHRMDISNLSSGVYLVKLTSGGQSATKKLIIE